MAPVVADVAPRVSVPPLHSGALLLRVGVAGCEGSFNVTGPTGRDVHPKRVTVMLLYVAAVRFAMIMLPAPFAVNVILMGVALKL